MNREPRIVTYELNESWRCRVPSNINESEPLTVPYSSNEPCAPKVPKDQNEPESTIVNDRASE